MKKSGILHKELAACIAQTGHFDQLSLVSCLYGIPKDATIIDLALKREIPRMIEVLSLIEAEMIIEKIIIAEEMKDYNHQLSTYIIKTFETNKIETIANDSLKDKALKSKVFIRTGENMRFSNVLLQAGFSE